MKRTDGFENRPTTFARDYIAALAQLNATMQWVMVEWPTRSEYKLLPIHTINGMKLVDYIALQQKEA